MKDYIKFYKYDADYQAAKPNLPVPHAVYCWETNITDISEPLFNEKQYLAFKAVDGDATLTFSLDQITPQFYYSYDQVEWIDWTAAGFPELEILDGNKIYIKGLNDAISKWNNYSSFGGTGYYEVSGSLSSLLDGDDIYGNLNKSSYKEYLFDSLFYNNICIIKADIEIPYIFNTDAAYVFQNGFYNCQNLQSVTVRLNEDSTYIPRQMFNRAFQGCVNLKTFNIELPQNTKYIGTQAFYYAFYNCSSLTRSDLTIPYGVVEIKNGAFGYTFYKCSSLTYSDIIIPDTVTTLGSSIFQECYRYCTLLSNPQTINLVDAKSSIYESTYYNTSITSANIYIKGDIENRSMWATFELCSKLETVDLVISSDSTFKTTGAFSYTFTNCSKLTKMTISHYPAYYDTYKDWLNNVPNQSSNKFRIYRAHEAAWPRSSSGIPTNWTIEYLD